MLGVGVAAALLARTLVVAQNISDKAATIATTGRGINTATDSIIQLNRTNEAASSILESARPLEASLTTIVGTAGEINTLAGSINGSAGSINGSAGGINNSAGTINTSAIAINDNAVKILGSATTINGVASGINGKAAEILDVAQRIDVDAKNINTELDETIGIAKDIKGDTAAILREAIEARETSSCIAEKLNFLVLPLLSTGNRGSGDCPSGD
ncbi:MAG: hypothetical protein ACRDRK_13490 [Pseudonocardia sp.]